MHKARLETINKLFLQYRRNFEIGDAQQVADFYRFPLHYYRENGSKQAIAREEFVQQVNKLLHMYRRLNVSQIVGTVTDVIGLNDSSSLTSLNWILLRADGDKTVPLYSSTTRYLVSDTAGGLKIDGLILVDETAKIRGAIRARRQAGRQVTASHVPDRYAVVGNPIAQSLSPQIHRAFAQQTGEKILYEKVLVPIGGFADFARPFFAAGGCGLNVTLPFKLDACAFADELSQAAEAAGAVNTLRKTSDGRIQGHNTDGAGLVADILHSLHWPIAGKKILLIGAGGAARGVIQPLLRENPESIFIANRTAHKARQLAELFARDGRVAGAGFDKLSGDFDLLINASAASLSGELPPLPCEIIGCDGAAYDMVYGAEPTPFMLWAQQSGAQVADGLGMLVGQAAESFYWWRDVRPNTAAVLAQLRSQLQKK